MNITTIINEFKKIDVPRITSNSCVCTGIEFRIFTGKASYFESGLREWPIKGPIKFRNEIKQIFKKHTDLEVEYFLYNQNEFFLEQVLLENEIQQLKLLSDEETEYSYEIFKKKQSPEIEYYIYDDCEKRRIFNSYFSAEHFF